MKANCSVIVDTTAYMAAFREMKAKIISGEIPRPKTNEELKALVRPLTPLLRITGCIEHGSSKHHVTEKTAKQ